MDLLRILGCLLSVYTEQLSFLSPYAKSVITVKCEEHVHY